MTGYPPFEYVLGTFTWLGSSAFSGFSTRTERAILLREELTVWEAAWGSLAFNHRILLFSTQQTWLAVALGNCELHRCVATALYLGP